MDREPMMIRRDRFEAKDSLKFSQVFPPGRGTIAIIFPCIDDDPELVGYKMEERSERELADSEDDTGKTEIAELNRKTQAVRRTAALLDDGKVGWNQSVSPNQIVTVVRQGEQTLPLGGAEDRTTGHDVPLEKGCL
jgi:hypothetical protein